MRFWAVDKTEALAKAASSSTLTDEDVKSKMKWLIVSKAAHEKKVELLKEHTNHETNQKQWDFQSWQCTECEKYLSTTLPQEMKAKLEAKMSQLAEEFLGDNF